MKTKPKYVYVTYINTTPEKLWKALTDRKLIASYWSGRDNASTWKKGAPLESRSPEGELEWRGKILESKPGRLLSYTFDAIGSGEPPSRVVFEITVPKAKDKHQSRALQLTVTHDKFPAGSKVFEGIQGGWPTILSSLKTLLETGTAIDFTYQG